jgi:hypothetical protein
LLLLGRKAVLLLLMQDFSPPPLILLIVKQHCFELLWDCRSIIITPIDCEANLVMGGWRDGDEGCV